jgi:hypothetical protein
MSARKEHPILAESSILVDAMPHQFYLAEGHFETP